MSIAGGKTIPGDRSDAGIYSGGDPILVSDLKEGEVSALSGKIRKIQEMQEMSVSQAEEEKEQVKSLISICLIS